MIYREAHTLLEELAEATLAGTRKDYVAELATVPLLIIDDLGMRKLAHTAAEDLLEPAMKGTILKLLPNGYGFLQGHDAPGERLFFHARGLRTGLIFERDLRVGQRVTFERDVDPRSQREQAFDVRLLEADASRP